MNIITDSSSAEIIRLIDCAAASATDFYFCRLPGASTVFYDTECHATTIRPSDADTFVISTFGGETYFLAPGTENTAASSNPLPEATTRSQYDTGAEAIIAALRQSGGKTVYSRIGRHPLIASPGRIFTALLSPNPEAYIFIFSSRFTGTWIGASPELLLRTMETGEIETAALAGTRPAQATNTPDTPAAGWDAKNIEEHGFVTDFIIRILGQAGYSPRVFPLMTRCAGAVEHLYQRITARKIHGNCTPLQLARQLSPTPALCGYPREISRQRISRHELHTRRCYGGYSGLIRRDGQLSLYVTLRCAAISATEAALYLGGGLTAHSDIRSEWKETEAKSLWYTALKDIIGKNRD